MDGDQYPDIFLVRKKVSGLFINNGEGQFTESLPEPFVGMSNGVMAVADVNGDQHPYILITGKYNSKVLVTKLYINDGAGRFTEKEDVSIASIESGAVAIAAVNGDHHPDVVLLGETGFLLTSKGPIHK